MPIEHASSNTSKVLRGFVIAATVLLSGSLHAQQRDPVKIGLMSPLSGAQASLGFTARAGVELAVKEINATGGVLNRPIQIVFADDLGDPTQAVAEARRLVDRERVVFVAGPQASTITLAVAPVFSAAKVPNVHSSGSTAITPQVLPLGFSMFVPVSAQAEFMVRYAAETLKARRVAILTDNGAQAKDGQGLMRQEIAARKLELTGVQEHSIRASDMTPQLLTLRRDRPEVVLMITTTGEDAGLVAKTLKEIKWTVPVVSTTFANVMPVVMKVAGPDVFKDGNAVGVVYKAFTYCAGDRAQGSPFSTFLRNLKASIPKEFDQVSLNFVTFFYDAVYIFKAAAEATGSFDGERMGKWVEQNAASITGRATGQLAATASNHFLIPGDALATVARPDIRREDGMMQRQGC